MGLLGKLFKKAEQAAEAAKALVERAPRVRIQHHELDASFVTEEGQRFAILNLSTTGALLHSSPPVPANSVITGQLQLGPTLLPASFLVVHLRPNDFMGVAFQGDTAPLREAINAFLDAELLTLKMVRVAPQFLKPEDDGTPVWFSAGSKCQLHYVFNAQNHVLRFWILAFGTRAEWRQGGKVRTGVLESVAEGVDRLRVDAALFQEDEAPSVENLKPFRRIVGAIENVAESHRAQILDILR